MIYSSEVIVLVTDIVDAGSVIVIGVPDIEVVRVTGGMIMISIEVRVVAARLV